MLQSFPRKIVDLSTFKAVADNNMIRLIEWGFQHYFSHIMAAAYITHAYSGFHQYYNEAGALKCLAKRHSHEKIQRIQCSSNQGPLDY